MTQLGLLPDVEFEQGILAIRKLSGKSLDEAKRQLDKQAENWLTENLPLGYFIHGNVPSSKNSKTMVTVNRGGKEFTVPVQSAACRNYIKETKGSWIYNKVPFLNQVRPLSWPVSIEFTFIRETVARFDYINAAQILCDLMTHYGYIPDDEAAYIVPVFNRTVFYSRTKPGVLLKIIK